MPGPTTRVRAPCETSIIRRAWSTAMAERTLSRATPSVPASCRSEGSSSPGRSNPVRIM
ncbi:MAG: hypothetical protein IPI73_19105 [Betaproteobacteria bacterium]|nr:hypothetical protein [Betaproteobacteria bacterium]